MRQSLKFISAILSVVAVAGCSDVSTSPSVASRAVSAAPAFDFTVGGRYNVGDSKSSFVVTPDGGSFSINGVATVDFPASSICDPDLSTYGAGEWDNDCVPLTRAITITATTRLVSNGVAVDFQPALRFTPGKVVRLSTDVLASMIRLNSRYFATSPSSLESLAFAYSPSLGADPVADYLADSSLVTHVDLQTGRVWRRVKHFSGYVGGAGATCSDADCVSVLTYTP